jgi:hypothetical protein
VLEEAEVFACCVVETADRHHAPSIDRLTAL